MSSDPPKEFRVTLHTRPVRIAFLVDTLAPTAGADVDECIRYATGLWGGRHCPIVPIVADSVPDSWWDLLIASDPDFVVAFQPLSDTVVARINRAVAPGHIIELTESDRRQPDGVPRLHSGRVEALGVADLPHFMWTRMRALEQPTFLYLHDGTAPAGRNPFILRNIGVLPGDVHTKDTFRDLPCEEVDAALTTIPELLSKMQAHRPTITPLQLSASHVKKAFRPAHTGLNLGVQLVIGESPLDVVQFWNRGIASVGGRAPRTVWMSRDHLDDATTFEAICTWLERRSLSPGGPVTPAHVVSTSLTEAELTSYAKKFRQRLQFPVSGMRLDAFRAPDVGEPAFDQWAGSRIAATLIPATGVTLESYTPEFVASTRAPSGWMVDLQLDSPIPRSTVVSTTAPLPRRFAAGRAWFDGAEKVLSARVTNLGLPSILVSASRPAVHVRIPTALELFVACTNPRIQNSSISRPNGSRRFTSMRISEKGRYLSGLLALFGTVGSAREFFQDLVWSEAARRLSGDPEALRGRTRQRILRELHATCGAAEGRTALADAQLDELAHRLSGRVSLPEPLKDYMSIREFRGLAGQKKRPWQDVREELQSCCRSRILAQGCEASCPYCGSQNWYPVEDLKPALRCSGCRSTFDISPDPEWSYKLNALIRESIRRHGLVPVILKLGDLFRFGHESTGLVPCLELREKEDGPMFTDIDIAAVVDGKVILGEVKTSPEGYEPSDLDRLRVVAADLLPDEVQVLAGDGLWPDALTGPLKELKEHLSRLGIDLVCPGLPS